MACCAGPWTAKLEDCWAGLLDGIGVRLCEGAESMDSKNG
ncbi:predicted protein [Chaetomium globosum CBS 148.51]|uniref:Uncharacterized protein n=1 Tax=Chaetomium globosum (strain ATCC 6205 / CBS 148.51 / DSM 1962 / NBRC 6347 / NRRL 1970) TaxID=306901 RepID=Q2GP14_CHAGB|nr:uncharacterized protein CHGG_10290 [Chaetomium globosum CBS 148.51]EAQ83886.1 predicted protein [Chaetomium globosum CBS 148.51]